MDGVHTVTKTYQRLRYIIGNTFKYMCDIAVRLIRELNSLCINFS